MYIGKGLTYSHSVFGEWSVALDKKLAGKASAVLSVLEIPHYTIVFVLIIMNNMGLIPSVQFETRISASPHPLSNARRIQASQETITWRYCVQLPAVTHHKNV